MVNERSEFTMTDVIKNKVILASGSPRRREILTQIGVDFEVVVSNEEECPRSEDPLEFPRENAAAKALAVSKIRPGEYVLGFDTLVFLDGKPLGKPKSPEEALEMLKKLNGKSHEVITGVAIAKDSQVVDTQQEETQVFFRNCSLQELEDYVNSKDPMDKAGAYGIQTRGARLIKSISGCYYNVVGLPVSRTLDMLFRLKVNV